MKTWYIVVIALVVLVVVNLWISGTPLDFFMPPKPQPEAKPPIRAASLAPSIYVADVKTTKGKFTIVFPEKDAPETMVKFGTLLQQKKYDGVPFVRVETGLIQSGPATINVSTSKLEVMPGLKNLRGSVGMARVPDDPNSATSVFYILKEPAPNLDMQYTVFGRVVNGMDVVMKIKLGDKIISGKMRPRTDYDEMLYQKLLIKDTERTATK